MTSYIFHTRDKTHEKNTEERNIPRRFTLLSLTINKYLFIDFIYSIYTMYSKYIYTQSFVK